MVRIKGLMAAGCSLALCASQAWATDFFIQPTSPGPAGAPLGAIALQATTAEAEPELVEEPVDDGQHPVQAPAQQTANDRGNTAGKGCDRGRNGDGDGDGCGRSRRHDGRHVRFRIRGRGATDEDVGKVTAATAEATTTPITDRRKQHHRQH